QAAPGSDAGSVPAAAAADPDDFHRLHPRGGAAGDRGGRGGGDALVAGDGGLQRYARRHAVRHLPDAGLFLCHRMARRNFALRRFGGALGLVADARRLWWAGPRHLGLGDRPALHLGHSGRSGARPDHGASGHARAPAAPLGCGRPLSRAAAAAQHCDPGGFAVISHFFIDRPIFASVLSIIIVLAGIVAVTALPIAPYPHPAPPPPPGPGPYPGANARTVRDTVAAPIEQQVSGVENMLYMSSQCTNDGAYTLTVTFKLGMDSDMAQVLVQNRVALAQPVIPDLVQRQGIGVKKMSPSVMMIVNLVSPDGSYDDIYLSNYATIQIKDELGRLPGVASVSFLGQRDYSMRAWLDPLKMASFGISANDVVKSINEQNLQVAAGAIGQQPVPAGQQFQLTINTLGRLITVEQFGDIIVKVTPGNNNGEAAALVRLRDVARVELGSQQYA